MQFRFWTVSSKTRDQRIELGRRLLHVRTLKIMHNICSQLSAQSRNQSVERSGLMSTCSLDLQEIPQEIGLPSEYSAKRCRFCRCWSCSLCPWDLGGTELKKWLPVLPWGRGNREKPIGDMQSLRCCTLIAFNHNGLVK